MIRRRSAPAPTIPPDVRAVLEDGELPAVGGDQPVSLDLFMAVCEPHAVQALWSTWRAEILREWIRDHPGTRPAAWWSCEAPEPARRRLGGIGTPAHEVLAYAEHYELGIPAQWVSPRDVEYYNNGRARDVHGRPIGTAFREGDFRGVAIDADDPPRYEAQATYLERHELLTPAERRALNRHDFAPQLVVPSGVPTHIRDGEQRPDGDD